MAKVLQNFWILTETGATIFNRVRDSTVDDQYFGMFMSALNSYAEGFLDDGLSSFELSDKRFSFMKKNDLIFVGTSPLKTNEKKVIREIELIKNKFFELYPQDIAETWKGNIKLFSDFEKNILKSFQD